MAVLAHLLLLLVLATTTLPILSAKPTIQTGQQLGNIIEALIGAGDFGNWASALSVTDPSSFPITATLFIPTDTSVSDPSVFNPSTFGYHIVPRQLSFSDLLLLQVGSRLPTLLPGESILVTNNSRDNYSIDDARIVRPDLYINGAVSVHGIGSVLNFSAFGVGGVFFPFIYPKPDSSPLLGSSSSPDSSVNDTNSGHLVCSFPVIPWVVFALVGLKIYGV